MASYIGVAPPEQTGIVERYKYTGDGSTTAFSGADTNSNTLRYTSTNPVLVFLNGVQLVEGTDFTKTSNTVITFTTAPANSDDIEILTFGSFDLNSPTTIRCDLGLNTTDSPTFANTTLSGAGKLQLRDSGTYINSNADGDLDIVSDGTANESIKLTSAGGIYLQADGSSTIGTIRLDSQSGVINLYRDGTLTTSLNNEASGDVEIHSRVSNADIRIRGNDGGSDITALTFDMSAAGSATFNNDVKLGDSGKLTLGASDDLQLYHDASDSYIKDAGTGDLRIE